MGIVVYCDVVCDGKVIHHHDHTTRANELTNEMVGGVVTNAINEVRKIGYHMAAPNIRVQLEFKTFNE